MALTDLTRISTSGIATGSTIDAAILRKDVSFRGSQVGVTSALFDSSDNALEFNEGVKIKFGDKFSIYKSPSHAIIDHEYQSGSYLRIGAANGIILGSPLSHNQDMIRGYVNGRSELFFAGNRKFQTTQTGAIVTGILTATGFSGPLSNASGISTFYDLRVTNNLTVEGTTSTLDTTLIGVDRVEVGANSNSIVGVAVTQSGTADIVRLYDGATQRVTVDDQGRVGIGSDIPVAHLDVANYQNIEVLRLRDRHFNKYLTIRGGGSPNRMIIDSYEGGGGGADIDLASNGSTKVRIKSNGKVGINEVNPTEMLHIKAEDNTDSFGGIIVYANNNSVYTKHGWRGLDSNEAIRFAISGTEKMRLTNGGKLALGRSSADEMMHITNDDNTDNYGGIKIGANNGSVTVKYGWRGIDGSETLRFAIGGNEKLRITSSGTVNIGNNYGETANLFALDTNYEGFPSDSAQPEAILLIKGRGSNNRYVGIGASNTGSWIQASGPGYSGPTSVFCINPAGGNVAIGHQNPNASLHVSRSGYQTLRLQNTDNGADGPYIELYNNSSSPADNDYTGILSFKNRNTNNEEITYSQIRSQSTDVTDGTEDGILTFHTRGNGTFGERLRITSDGKIGIGHHISTQITNGGSELTIRPADDGGILIGRPGDTVAPINKALTITTTTTGSEAYHTKYHTYNCNSIFATYEGGGTGGNFIFKTGVGSGQEEEKLRITPDGQLAVNYLAHHTSVSGIFAANATTSGRFSYKAIEIGTAIASGTDQGALIVARRKASSSSPATLVGSWDDGTDVTLYYGGGWSSHAGSATRLNFYTDTYATGNNSGGTRLSIGSKGQIFLNNRDSNNASHRGNIIAYAPPSGEFAYKSLEIGSTNSSSNDTGGLIVAQRKGTSAYPFALLGSWDNGSACTVYIGGGWGSQSANATQLNFYTSSNAGSGGSSGHVRLSIDTNGEAIFYKNVAVGGGHPWAVTGSPYNNLSISGSDASSSGFLNLGNGAAATNADFDLSRIKFHNGATEVATIRATTATSDSGDSHLRFFTKKAGSGTKEVLRIRNDGIVETMYSENQQSYAHNISPTPCIRARNHYAGNGIYAGIQLFNQRTSGAAAVADIGVVNDASTDYVSYLTFTTRNSDTTYSEKIRIDSGGQIRYQYANNAKHGFALRETTRTITGHSTTGYQYIRCALLNSRTAYRCAVSTQGGNYGPGVQFFTVLRSWDSTTFYVTDKLNIGSAYANAVRMQSDNAGGTYYIEVNISLSTTSQGFNLSVTPLAANSGDMTTALQFYGSGMSNLTNTSSAASL